MYVNISQSPDIILPSLLATIRVRISPECFENFFKAMINVISAFVYFVCIDSISQSNITRPPLLFLSPHPPPSHGSHATTRYTTWILCGCGMLFYLRCANKIACNGELQQSATTDIQNQSFETNMGFQIICYSIYNYIYAVLTRLGPPRPPPPPISPATSFNADLCRIRK